MFTLIPPEIYTKIQKQGSIKSIFNKKTIKYAYKISNERLIIKVTGSNRF